MSPLMSKDNDWSIVANGGFLLRQKRRTQIDRQIEGAIERITIRSVVTACGFTLLVKRDNTGRDIGNAELFECCRPEPVNGECKIRKVPGVQRLLAQAPVALRFGCWSLLRHRRLHCRAREEERNSQ